MIKLSYIIILLLCVSPVCDSKEVMLHREHTRASGKECHCGCVMFSQPLFSLIRCITTCVSTSGCLQVFYDKYTQQCVGCSSLQYQDSTLLSTSQLYVKQQMTYIGCFFDSEDRILDGHMELFTNNGPVTNERCSQICDELGFRYSGTEGFQWCLCGHSYDPLRSAPEGDCNMLCIDDPSQYCGSDWRISIYRRF